MFRRCQRAGRYRPRCALSHIVRDPAADRSLSSSCRRRFEFGGLRSGRSLSSPDCPDHLVEPLAVAGRDTRANWQHRRTGKPTEKPETVGSPIELSAQLQCLSLDRRHWIASQREKRVRAHDLQVREQHFGKAAWRGALFGAGIAGDILPAGAGEESQNAAVPPKQRENSVSATKRTRLRKLASASTGVDGNRTHLATFQPPQRI